MFLCEILLFPEMFNFMSTEAFVLTPLTPLTSELKESLLLEGIEESDAHGFAILLGISDISENLG